MKNKKLMFSEARFVFGVPGTPPPKPASTPPITLTSAQRARILKEQRASALKASVESLQKTQTLLKTNELDLGGKTFEVDLGQISLSATLIKLQYEVLSVLNSKKNEDTVKMFVGVLKLTGVNAKLADVKPIAAKVYARGLLDKAQKKLDAKYPRLSEYLKGKKDAGLKAKFSSGATGLEVALIEGDKDLQKKYKDWEKVNPSKDGDKNKRLKEAKDKVSQADFEYFKKSPLGKIFGMLRGEGNKTWLELMKDGKSPLAFFIAGLCGYEIGKEMFDGVADMAGEHKGKIMGYARKARNSKVGAKAYAKKLAGKTAKIGKDAEGVTATMFKDVIEQNSVPAKGLKLEGDYKLGSGETLSVDLTGGGQIVLPKGVKAYVDGELSDPGKVYKNVKIKFSNTIPKGTVFVGKIVFKKSAPTKAAPTKAT